MKNSAADVGSEILDGASSLLDTSKVKRIEAENMELTAQVQSLQPKVEDGKRTSVQRLQELRGEYEGREKGLRSEDLDLRAQHAQELDEVNRTLSQYKTAIIKKFVWFPMAKELLRIEKLCKVSVSR